MRRRTTTASLAAIVVFLSLCTSSFAVRARVALNTVLPDLNFTGVTLADALDFLRDVTGANVHVNWTALEAAGMGKDAVLNIHLRNIPMRKVLSLVLSEAGGGDLLAYYVADDVIEVTTKELADKDMITRIYPIDDLIMAVPDFVGPDMSLQGSSAGGSGTSGGLFGSTTGGDKGDEKSMTRAERAQALIDMITSIINPDIWQVNGGTAAIRFFNGSLIVTAPRSVHEALGGPVD